MSVFDEAMNMYALVHRLSGMCDAETWKRLQATHETIQYADATPRTVLYLLECVIAKAKAVA